MDIVWFPIISIVSIISITSIISILSAFPLIGKVLFELMFWSFLAKYPHPLHCLFIRFVSHKLKDIMFAKVTVVLIAFHDDIAE